MRTGLLILAGLAAIAALIAGARFALAPKPFAPSFTVVASHGYGVVEAESRVAIPIEHALAGLDGVTSLKTHVDGHAVTVRGDLKPGVPPDAAIAEAINRVSAAQLDTLPTVISERAPVLRSYLSLETDTLPAGALNDLAETQVRLKLLQQPGFRDVEVCGPGMTGTTIELDPVRLAGGDPREVLERLRGITLTHPAGVGAFVVRGGGPTLEELRALDLGSGRRLDDVAIIRDEPLGPPCWAYRHGRASVGMLVSYLAEADPKPIHSAGGELPSGVRTRPMRIDRVIDFGSGAPPEALALQIERLLRASRTISDAAVEVRPLGKGSTAVAYLELNDPKAPSVLGGGEPRMVHLEGEALRGVAVAGPDLDSVERAARAVEELLNRLGPCASTLAPKLPEVRVELDRPRLAQLQLPVSELTESLQLAGEEGVDIGGGGLRRVRLKLPKMADEDLATLRVGKGVPLATVAKMVRDATPAWIDREDGLRVVRFQTAASEGQVRDALKTVQIPPGVVLRIGQGN